MPRNSSGTYTLPEAAFTPNTPILSADMNSNNDDIADGLTDSLSRSGDGGMQAVLELDDTGLTYTADPNTGIYRSAADTQIVKAGGVDILEVGPDGIDVLSGTISVGGVGILPIGLGPLPWSGTAAPTGWVLAYGQSLLRADYTALWAFAEAEIALSNLLYTNGNGTTTFTVPDLCGRLPGGKDDMGGSAASRLTSTTMTPNGTTLGAVGGTQTVTVVTGNLPAYTPAGLLNLNAGTLKVTLPFSDGAGGTPSVSSKNLSTSSEVLVTGAPAGTFAGTAQGGLSTPVNKIQPTIVTNYIIYAGA